MGAFYYTHSCFIFIIAKIDNKMFEMLLLYFRVQIRHTFTFFETEKCCKYSANHTHQQSIDKEKDTLLYTHNPYKNNYLCLDIRM